MNRRGDKRYNRSGPLLLACILALLESKNVFCFVSTSWRRSAFSSSSLASMNDYLGSLNGNQQREASVKPSLHKNKVIESHQEETSLEPSLHTTKVVLEEEEEKYEDYQQEIQVVRENEYTEEGENDDEEDAERLRDSEFMAQAIIAAQNV